MKKAQKKLGKKEKAAALKIEIAEAKTSSTELCNEITQFIDQHSLENPEFGELFSLLAPSN